MGALLDVLPPEATSIEHHEDNGKPVGSDFVVITNTPETSLHFNPKQSRLLAFGIDQQIHPSFSHKSLGYTVKLDTLEVALSFLKQHNMEDNFDVFNASDRIDQCTHSGMKQALITAAQKVGPEGLFVVFFGGHGVNDSINHEWALLPADYDRTPNTYITASDLTECLTQSKCQARYVLLILDCCYSGAIATNITQGASSISNIDTMLSNVYVLASGTSLQSSFSVGTLRHSIFSYFFKRALSTCSVSKGMGMLMPDGVLPLMDIFKECQTCCQALSSLMLSLDKSGNELKVCETVTVPSLTYFTPHVEDRGQEEDVDYEPTAGRLSFVMQLLQLYRCQGAPSPSLHQLTFQWLRKLIQSLHNPLSILDDRGLLVDAHDGHRVLKTVIALIMQSIAYIELVHNRSTVGQPALFLVAFVHTIATVDLVHPNLVITLEHLCEGRSLYYNVLVQNGIDDSLMKELFQEMDALKVTSPPSTTTN